MRNTPRRRSPLVAVVAVLGLALAAACGSDDTGDGVPGDDVTDTTVDPAPGETDDPVEIALPSAHDAWVRMPAMGQTMSAGYVTFVNDGPVDLPFTSVRSSLATAELHETLADDEGVMRMQERPEGFVVPANGEFVMAPGGAHVMFIGVDPLDMAMLDEVEMVFDFGDVGELTVIAEIRRDESMPGHGDMHDHTHGDTHDDDAHGDMHGEADDAMHGHDGPVELDPDALHALDDELHADVFEPERQRALVASQLAALDQVDPSELPSGFDVDRFREALEELDAALAAEDLAAARMLAVLVHDLAHVLMPHHH